MTDPRWDQAKILDCYIGIDYSVAAWEDAA
jgi:hypothetical protein